MMTFREIIDHAGIATLSQAFDVAASHIHTMRTRNSIPPEYWDRLLGIPRAGKLANLDYPELLKMRSALKDAKDRTASEPARAAS